MLRLARAGIAPPPRAAVDQRLSTWTKTHRRDGARQAAVAGQDDRRNC
jgi:hypothetical protein